MLTTYCIYPDNVGELSSLDRDTPPEFVWLTMALVGEEPARFKAPLIGFRWVGKVQAWAFVYDGRTDDA